MLNFVPKIFIFLFVPLAGFLLLSMGGGAIMAAPVTLPLLYLVVRHQPLGRGWSIAALVVFSLTVGQCAIPGVLMVGGTGWLSGFIINMAMIGAGMLLWKNTLGPAPEKTRKQ